MTLMPPDRQWPDAIETLIRRFPHLPREVVETSRGAPERLVRCLAERHELTPTEAEEALADCFLFAPPATDLPRSLA